jgi:hypothetical protein
MNPLLTSFRSLALSGRLLARLVFPARPRADHAEGRLPLPPRPPATTETPFVEYLIAGWSGGGRR